MKPKNPKRPSRPVRRRTGEVARKPAARAAEHIFEVLPDLIFRLDSRGVFLEFMGGRQQELYLRPEEFIGKPVDKVLPPDVAEFLVPRIQRVLRSGKPASVDYLLPMEDGPRRFEARLIPSGEGDILVLVRSVAQERGAETALRELDERYHGLVELSPSAIAVHDGKAVLYVNRAAADLLADGERDRLVGRPIMAFVHPDSRKAVAERVRKMLASRKPMPLIEERFLRADGAPVEVEVTASSFQEGDRTLVQVIFRDIARRKADERAIARLSRLNALLGAANQAIARATDRDALLREICRIAVEQGGMRAAWAGLVDGKRGAVLPVASFGDLEGYAEAARIRAGSGPRGRGPTGRAVVEDQVVLCNDIKADPAMAPWRKEALKRGFRSSAAVPIRLRGRVVGALNLYAPAARTFGDRELEVLESLAADLEFALGALDQERRRREAEAALAESEENFRGLFEHSKDGIYITAPDGHILSCNAAALRMFGYTVQEMGSVSARDLYAEPEDRKRFIASMERDGAVQNFEVRLKRKDGSVFDGLLSASLQRGAGGEVLGYQGIIHDITERKRMEEALRSSEQRFRDIVEHSTNMFYAHTPDHVLTYVSPQSRVILDCEPEEALVPWTEFATDHPVNEAGLEATRRAIDTGEPQPPYELQLRTRNGRLVWVEVHEAPVVRDGRTSAIVGALTDITERKVAAEELLVKDRAIATALTGIAMMDLKGRLTYVNDSIVKMWGYADAREVLGRSGREFWANQEPSEAAARVLRERGTYQGRLTAIRRDGSTFPVEFSGHLVHDAAGRPLCLMGSFMDVTERLRAEEALRASEEKYKALVETTGTGFVILDGEGRVLDANDDYVRLTGRAAAADLLGRPVTEWTAPEDRERNAAEVRKCLAAGTVRNLEVGYIGPDGRVTPVEISATVMRTGEGDRIVSLVRDITERKAAEAALRESEAQMRALNENLAHGMVYQIDSGPDGTRRRMIYTSPAVERLHGLSVEEVLRDPSLLYAQVVEADRPRLEEAEARAFAERSPLNIDVQVRTASGEVRWSRFLSTPRTLPDGRIVWDGIEFDITEGKRAGLALRESEEKYRTLVESARDAIFLADAETGVLIDVNRQAEILTGRPAAELIGRPQSILHPPDEVERYRNIFALHAKAGTMLARDLLVRRADGTDVPVDISASVLEIGDRKVVQGLFQDVSDRKRAENALRESLDMLQRSMQGTILAMMTMVEMRDPFTAGHQSRVARLACAIGRALGMNEHQVEGLRVAGLLHDIGKIGVPAEILSKPGRILDFEYNIIKSHSEIGHKILKEVDFPWPIAQMVLQHHERLDGSGYPSGLKGDVILLEARILVVADVVEAMASHRPYRPARGLELALGEIEMNRGILYDPEVVDACAGLFKEHRFSLD